VIESAAPPAPRCAAALVAAVLAGGCATIVAGGPDDFSVATKPPGAYVYLNGHVVGQTPMTISLDRSRHSFADIRVYYPGFQPVAFTRYQAFNMWVLGNFFIGMIPAVVDFATGNWQRFDDDDITVTLVPGDSPPPYGIEPRLPGQRAPTFGNPPPGGPPTGNAPTFGNPPPGGPPTQEPRPPGPQ